MKNLYPFVLVLLAACASTASKTASVAEPPPPAPMPSLEALKPLAPMCLGYPMHALRVVAVDATPEQRAKADAESYAFSFEDAEGQREYVECLERDPASPDYAKYHANALKWYEDAKARRDRYAAALPEGRRIASVKTSFADVDEKRSKMVTAIVRNDGSREVLETVFDKLPR